MSVYSICNYIKLTSTNSLNIILCGFIRNCKIGSRHQNWAYLLGKNSNVFYKNWNII